MELLSVGDAFSTWCLGRVVLVGRGHDAAAAVDVDVGRAPAEGKYTCSGPEEAEEAQRSAEKECDDSATTTSLRPKKQPDTYLFPQSETKTIRTGKNDHVGLAYSR